jgi:hypothetical protein
VTDKPIAEFSLYISKVSVEKSAGGVMHWRATASDVSEDLYRERMSNELYDDFVRRIETKSAVAAPFDKVLGEDWKGGMPYLSVSHYKSGTGNKNVPGMPTKIYRDGGALKAVGTLNDNDLGRAVFKSLCDDLYTEKAKELGKIRISIGFLDLEHKHAVGKGKTPDYTFTRKGLADVCPMCQEGIGNKIYTKGQLVHLALTRVPVNPRTNMEVAKAMAIETKKQDAESIVGKELSDTLEEKSLLSSYLVTKSTEETKVEEKANLKLGLPGQEPGLGIAVGGNVADTEEALEEVKTVGGGGDEDYDDDELEGDTNKKGVNNGMDMRPVAKAKVAADKQSEELTYDEPDEDKREARRNTPAGEKSLLQKSFETLESKIVELKSQGVPAEAALREIQPAYNALGESIKKSLQPELSATDAKNTEISELTNIVKSLAETVATLQQSMSTEIATLKAQTAGGQIRQLAQGIPMPRSLTGSTVPQQAQQIPPLPGVPESLRSMAYKSTFTR